MKNIENLFVSYELALLAKDLKLGDVCIGAYNKKFYLPRAEIYRCYIKRCFINDKRR